MSLHTEDKTAPTESQALVGHNGIPLEDEEEMVTFLDRCIAFLLLIAPWAYLIVWVQDMLLEKVSTTVINMTVLAGMIGFLLVVDKVSKRIYRLRADWRK